MTSRTLFFALALSLVACSDEDGPRFDTGLPEDEPANELSPAESVAACEAYEDSINATFSPADQANVACTIAGVSAELFGVGTCEEMRDTCLEDPALDTAPADLDCETATSFAPSGCTATVGELEACVNDYMASIDSLKGRITCGLASDAEALADATADFDAALDPATQPSCAALPPECLDLLGFADAGAGAGT